MPEAISGMGGMVSSIGGPTTAGGAFSAISAFQDQIYNSEQVQNQRDYETQMSDTAYQRASADMKAAGLNPMLAAMNQSPASTPSTGLPPSPPDRAQAAISGAMSTAQGLTNIKSQNAQAELNLAQKDAVASQIKLNTSSAAKADADTKGSLQHQSGVGALGQTINGGLNSALQAIKNSTQNIHPFQTQQPITVGAPSQ